MRVEYIFLSESISEFAHVHSFVRFSGLTLAELPPSCAMTLQGTRNRLALKQYMAHDCSSDQQRNGANDMTRLDTLNRLLSKERLRLVRSKSEGERLLRAAWVAQIEKEIEAECTFIANEHHQTNIADDDLLRELLS